MRRLLLLILVALPLFIGVAQAQTTTYGPSNELCWIAPTTYANGTALTVAGYTVEWSTTTTGTPTTKNITAVTSGGLCPAGTVGITLGSLATTFTGTEFFEVAAFDAVGNVSAPSNQVTGSFLVAPLSAPTSLGLH